MLVAVSLVIAGLLVAFGGLMAAVDAALGVLSRADLADLAGGSRSHRFLGAIARDPGSHAEAVGFARVVGEMTAAVLVTLAFESVFDAWWLSLVISALLMTGVSFVLVGASPRSVGRAHAAGLVRGCAPLVRALRVSLGPLADGLVAFGNWVTPSLARRAPVASEEQLLSIVDEATALDVLEEDDREFIHSIFEFGDTVVREVMIPRTDMITVREDLPLDDAMGVLLGRGLSRVPVLADDVDDVRGVLYLRDLARIGFERRAEDPMPTAGELAHPAVFVPESKNVDELLRQMQLESNHLAMVVDEYGGIAGLVTLEDIIEELVGDISDEYDRDIALVEELSGGRYRVSARLPVAELGELFDLDLDDDEVDTAGGLLGKWLGRLPSAGSRASGRGLSLTAERTEGRRRRLTTIVAARDDESAGLGPVGDGEEN